MSCVCVHILHVFRPCQVLCLHFLLASIAYTNKSLATLLLLVTLLAYSCKPLHQDVVPVAVVLEQHNYVGRPAKINVACFPLYHISLTY